MVDTALHAGGGGGLGRFKHKFFKKNTPSVPNYKSL
jgi:hypothetical protein